MKTAAGFLALFLLLLNSCKEPAIGLEPLGDRVFSDTTMVTLRNWSADGKFIRAFSIEASMLIFFDAGTGKIHTTVPLNALDTISSERRLWGIVTRGPDSVFVVIPHTKLIFLLNQSGRIVNRWEVKGNLTGNFSDFALITLTRSAPLITGNKIYMTCARKAIQVNTKAARIEYFKTPGEIVFDLKQPEKLLQNTSGLWPQSYRNGAGYRDYYPQRCINAKGQTINGFSADDSIFVYEQGKRVAAHYAKSKYMTARKEYPDDSTGNFAFMDRYTVEEPRYLSMDYDPYRKMYYRIVHHAQQYVSNDSITLNQSIDKNWSLMMLDENFQVVGDVQFDPKQYLPAVLITPEGIMVMRRNESLTMPKATFTLFQPESL
ncbi:MAG: DUF4221 domain-containing protein [Bacteroidia bacterium]|jgi:hypothetical protein|nr:DUF4221 domain-containing protein [Bacteroidia bacterium]